MGGRRRVKNVFDLATFAELRLRCHFAPVNGNCFVAEVIRLRLYQILQHFGRFYQIN